MQFINSISDKTVDLPLIRILEVEDIIHYAKENHPQIWDNLDEKTEKNF